MQKLYFIYTKIKNIRSFYLRVLIEIIFRLLIIFLLPLSLVLRILYVIILTLMMKGVSFFKTKKFVKLKLWSFIRISTKSVCVLIRNIIFNHNLFSYYILICLVSIF